MGTAGNAAPRPPWNKGKIVGQKAPLKLKDPWALRVRLQMDGRTRELALFNLGIDSKLRGCDLVAVKVRDVCHGDQMTTRAIVMQHKTRRPGQFGHEGHQRHVRGGARVERAGRVEAQEESLSRRLRSRSARGLLCRVPTWVELLDIAMPAAVSSRL